MQRALLSLTLLIGLSSIIKPSFADEPTKPNDAHKFADLQKAPEFADLTRTVDPTKPYTGTISVKLLPTGGGWPYFTITEGPLKGKEFKIQVEKCDTDCIAAVKNCGDGTECTLKAQVFEQANPPYLVAKKLSPIRKGDAAVETQVKKYTTADKSTNYDNKMTFRLNEKITPFVYNEQVGTGKGTTIELMIRGHKVVCGIKNVSGTTITSLSPSTLTTYWPSISHEEGGTQVGFSIDAEKIDPKSAVQGSGYISIYAKSDADFTPEELLQSAEFQRYFVLTDVRVGKK